MIRVCYPFIGRSIGGSHISTLMLLEHLDRHRFDPFIVLHEDGPLGDYLKARGFEFTLLPLSAYAGNTPTLRAIGSAMVQALPRLRRFLLDHRVDLVHANDLRCNLSWSPAARLVSHHVWHQRSALSSSMKWWSIGLLADRIICISESVRASLPSPLRTRARVIMNPFRTETPTPVRKEARRALLDELALDPDCRLVGTVGRLVLAKGLRTFVQAAALLARRFPGDVAFICAGDGEAGAELTRLAVDLGVGDRLHLLGFRYPVEPVLAALDVLVAPSPDEGFGRSLVEAMLVGTPVVASDIPAHREVRGKEETMRLVQAGDAEALAAAVLDVLSDPVRSHGMVECALVRSKSTCSGAVHARLVMDVYLDLLEGTARREGQS